MVEVFGETGRQWVAELPDLLDEFARRWALALASPFDPLSYNYVAAASAADGRPVVLKAGVPRPELRSEIEALRVYAGRGSVRLLQADAARGVMLLERIRPGNTLTSLTDDARATEIAAGVMQALWRPLPPDHTFTPVTGWIAAFTRLRARHEGGSGPLPTERVALAEQLLDELAAAAGPAVLLHGDLHHENILAGDGGQWLAIDPVGAAGEPVYETGALLRNPTPRVATWPDLPRIQARRVDQLAEILGFDRQRIAAYGVAQAVLSACWTLEDHNQIDHGVLACADALLPLLAERPVRR